MQASGPATPCRFFPADDVEGHSVLLVFISPGTTLYYTQNQVAYVRDYDKKGEPYNRRLSPEEFAKLSLARGQVSFEATANARATLRDLDGVLIEEYLKSRNTSEKWEELLLREGLLERKEGQNVPTNAAILLFGKNPGRYLDRCDIDFVKYEGTEPKVGRQLNIVKRKSFEGPLPRIIREAFNYVKEQVRERTPLLGLTFEPWPEYPELAWQEAIINSVAHRDYARRGTPIFARLFDDRMEIESPGTLVPPNTVEGIRSGKYSHSSRNPRIVRVLYDLGFMRRLGEGVRRMMQEMQQSDLNPPEFSEPDHAVRVILRNTPIFQSDTPQWLKQFNGFTLTLNHKRALAHLHTHRSISNSEYRKMNGVTRELALRELKRMTHMGLIQRTGKGSGSRYVLSAPSIGVQPRLPISEEDKLYAYLLEHGSITNRGYRALMNVKADVARNRLKDYVRKGLLRLEGARRASRYFWAGPQKSS